ncbi:hypothetical protein RJD28_10915 [Oscillospiraceae bacterium NTUH-002-81]|nr:hypothetical protein RJD28_10915 [Oscillospiraceae bacterium NTUH-002-81]
MRRGEAVIPLLSGHAGGGNALALQVAALLGATPVLTTATDVNGQFAVDVFARKNGLKIREKALAKEGFCPGFTGGAAAGGGGDAAVRRLARGVV